MEVVQSPVEDAGRLFAIAQRPLEIDLVHDDVRPFLMEIDDAFLAVAVDDEDRWRFLIGCEAKPGFNAVVEDRGRFRERRALIGVIAIGVGDVEILGVGIARASLAMAMSFASASSSGKRKRTLKTCPFPWEIRP